jgi:hypothetical protein
MKNAVFWDVMLLAVVRIDVSEERISSIIRVKRISELGTMLALARNRRILKNRIVGVSYKHTSVANYCYRSLLADSFNPDDGGYTFLRNASSYKNHTALHPEDGIL